MFTALVLSGGMCSCEKTQGVDIRSRQDGCRGMLFMDGGELIFWITMLFLLRERLKDRM